MKWGVDGEDAERISVRFRKISRSRSGVDLDSIVRINDLNTGAKTLYASWVLVARCRQRTERIEAWNRSTDWNELRQEIRWRWDDKGNMPPKARCAFIDATGSG